MSHHYLLIRSQQEEGCYGPFAAEILSSEGLNSFETVDIDSTEFPEITPDDIVVLPRCFLRLKEVEILVHAVENGARLVCFHPPMQLLTRLGWAPQNKVLYPGRIAIRSGYPGARLTLQTHVPIVLCKPGQPAFDYRIVATAAGDDGKEASFPAIVHQPFGAGEVVLFLYDLSKAVARIRLGNPDLASHVTTGGWHWPHAGDLFVGYVDPDLANVPQADIHCQLVAKLLTLISPQPLARFWYYEEPQHRTAAVFSSDDDWSTPEQFRALSDALVKRGGKGTFYLVKETNLGDEQLSEMRQLGHTFAPHVNAYGDEEIFFTFPSAIAEETVKLENRIGTLSTSLQTHCAPWYGYTDFAPLCRQHGFRMLMQHISIPLEWLHAFLCGSGRPMKFVDLDGTIYDSWQQPGAVFDDASLVDIISNDLDSIMAKFNTMLSGCLYDHHTPVAIASHPVSFATYSHPYIEACFDAFARKQLPIYNTDEWCALADRRRNVKITSEGRSDNTLTWRIHDLKGRLPLMVPAADIVTREATVHVNGSTVEGVWQRRLEDDYLFIQLDGDGEKEIQVDIHL
jgi:hypothetical protein